MPLTRRLVMLGAVAPILLSTAHADEIDQLKVTVHKIERRSISSRIVYTVRNSNSRRVDRVRIACSLRGADGKPVGAEIGYVSNVAPMEEVVGETRTSVTDVATATCRPTDITISGTSR